MWAGDSEQQPPEQLDAAIVFAPVGALVPVALRALAPGGTVVCGGIHMSDIPAFPYELLWQERAVRSVANLTRRDAVEMLELAPRVPVRTQRHRLPAGARRARALEDLRGGAFHRRGRDRALVRNTCAATLPPFPRAFSRDANELSERFGQDDRASVIVRAGDLAETRSDGRREP